MKILLFLFVSVSVSLATTHNYYIAAEETWWDYAPVKPSNGVGSFWLNSSSNRIGSTYLRARYVGYTDDTFSVRQPISTEWQHLGILGPVIRARVGDTIQVYFRNKAVHPYSLYPHGIFQEGSSEGSAFHGIQAVNPGETKFYQWIVPEEASPGPNDPDTILWTYHSHLANFESNNGLVGPILISRANTHIDAVGKPLSVDREFILYFSVSDEMNSYYLQENMEVLLAPKINFTELIHDSDFQRSNLKHGINGRLFGNLQGIKMNVGDRVRWYLFSLGDRIDIHTVYIHGQTGLYQFYRVDSIGLLPGEMKTIDTIADVAGTWMINCHNDDHMKAGMVVFYSVFGNTGESSVVPEVTGVVHEYYIAATEVLWDYAPNKPENGTGDKWLLSSSSRIGSQYIKAQYVEYTDNTFQTKKQISSNWTHLGLLGPVLRAQVGDTIRVYFKNMASNTYSMHPHGVFYDKESEGAFYPGLTSTGGVSPGETYTYEWYVPERAGPGPNDASSVLWMYHSHVTPIADMVDGLIGPIIITRKNTSIDENGMPTDIDKEFVLLFTITNEGDGNYIQDNIEKFLPNANPSELLSDINFRNAMLMHGINGKVFGNLDGLSMKVGDRVRWYFISLGSQIDLHTIHLHAQTGIWRGTRTDVVSALPGELMTYDVVIDTPGKWMIHCHVSNHVMGGMIAFYYVDGNETVVPETTGVVRQYYISTEEVDWNYSPTNPPPTTAEPKLTYKYKKVRYVAYTNDSWTERVPIPTKFQHLGLLGPLLRAQVGDVIRIHFRNNATYPYTLHPHGVFYEKHAEGAYLPGLVPVEGVPPGGEHIYEWHVPERAGPGPSDPSSIMWIYHSHVEESLDTVSGLIGPIIISRKNATLASDGQPLDVDFEFVLMFSRTHEYESHYAMKNVERINREKNLSIDINSTTYHDQTTMYHINGYSFDNLPAFQMNVHQKVRWYLIGIGGKFDVHSVHFHGQTVLDHGARKDVIGVLPAQMVTVDMYTAHTGKWMLHCQVHVPQGMFATYVIQLPSQTFWAWLLEHSSYIIAASIFFLSVCISLIYCCLYLNGKRYLNRMMSQVQGELSSSANGSTRYEYGSITLEHQQYTQRVLSDR